MTTIRNKLVEIQQSQSFERLEPFKQPAVWKQFSQEERILLARLLVMHGAHQFTQGDQAVLESFEMANLISGHAPEILFQQGIVLSSSKENIRSLYLASQAFAKSIERNSSFLPAWYMRGQVLVDIGLFEGEPASLSEALDCYQKVSDLLETNCDQINQEEFYWKWGFCFSSLGKISGEPSDFYKAIQHYRVAYMGGCRHASFLIDYGHSFADLAALLDKADYFAEALKLFNQSLRQDSQSFEGWYQQACCIKCLLEYTSHEKLIEQGEKSFQKAAELNPDHSQVWLKWGQFLTSLGKIKRDRPRLESSLEKYQKAYQLEPGEAQTLSCWADAVLFIAAQDDRLDLINDAKTKILHSLEIQPEDPDTWYLYGSCLNELGRYFQDEEYYNQAIEKFQYGLSLSRQHPLLWYGLALSHFALGELTEEQALFEKAVRYCSKVIESGGSGFSQFWNDWGVALLRLAELTEQTVHVELAIEKFERALKHPLQNIEIEDVDLEWVYNYGAAHDLLGDLTEESAYFEKAVQILTQVVQIDPEYSQARYNLSLALSHLAEAQFDVEIYHKSIEQFQILLEKDPEDEMVHLDFGMALTNLGLLVHDVHHPERSQALFREAENRFMQAAQLGNAQAYYQLAGLYSISGQFDNAMHALERAQAFDALPGVEDLLHDEWLERLRQTNIFRQFINELSSKQWTDEK